MSEKDYIFLKKESKRIKIDIENELRRNNIDENKVRLLLNLMAQTVNRMEKMINSMY